MAADDVVLTNLDQPLFEGAGATKGQLVDYLDAVADRIVPELRDRPLSVIRVTRGQAPFMQKNLPKHAPEWIERASIWAEASQRNVTYALCNDARTLRWFANQRAVEYHPTLFRLGDPPLTDRLVIDLDPPEGSDFGKVVAVAHLVHKALTASGLGGAVKTSGAKGIHVVVPIDPTTPMDDIAAATRALAARTEQLDPAIATTAFMKADRGDKVFVDATRAGGATVAAAYYSPRARPGVPVSFPLGWDELDGVTPADFTILTAVDRLDGRDPWADALPAPQSVPADLLDEGHAIPIPRVAAMHEGKRRKRAARDDS
jgi:DNA ligase D-like protein (predicted polymerase)